VDAVVSVDLSTLDIGQAAGGGIDFTDVINRTLTFPANNVNPQTVPVTIHDENLVEDDEAFETILNGLTSPLSGFIALGGNATSVIRNTDVATFSINDVSVSESDGTAAFTVSVDHPLESDVTLTISYTDLTATGSAGGAGADYDNTADQITFVAGDTSNKTVNVAITDDVIFEPDETFLAQLSTGTSLNVDTSDQGTGTIVDDDPQGNNQPPVITSLRTSAGDCEHAASDGFVSLAGTFTDPDSQDQHTAIIDWGDGSQSTASIDQSGMTLAADHQYTTGGIFTITVTLSDGTATATATTTAYVVGVRLSPSGILEIVGTRGRDLVTVLRWGWNQDPRVKVVARFGIGSRHGTEVYSFKLSDVNRIHMELCDGNDHGVISNGWWTGLSIPAYMNGGAGNDLLIGGRGDDTIVAGSGNDAVFGYDGDDLLDGGSGLDFLSGGSGNDILLGGSGCDWLSGGRGRDLLIGGWGSDTLLGGRDDDILIGARVTLDHQQLRDASDTWNSGQNYQTRVAWLTGPGDLLEPNTTVLDDGERDRLKGDQDRDLFFADLAGRDRDQVRDKKPFEDLLSLL